MPNDRGLTSYSTSPGRGTGARVVGFCGKGGGGKSTLLASTAVLMSGEWDVVVLDADLDNRSLVHWGQIRSLDASLAPIRIETPRAGEKTTDALARAMHDGPISDRPRLVLVDCPGGPRRHLPDGMYERVEVAYVPVEPTTTAVAATARLLADYRALGTSGPTVRIVVNRWASERRRVDAYSAFKELNVPVSRAVRSYVLHVDATASGMGVTEAGPSHKATGDIRSIAEDIGIALRVRDRIGPRRMSGPRSATEWGKQS